jgi:hypothetical protein
VLVLRERTGKAVRSPAASTLLGAVVGVTGARWPALLALAVPGAAAMGVLLWLPSRQLVVGAGPCGAGIRPTCTRKPAMFQ